MPLKVVPRRDRRLYRLVKRGEARALKRGEVLFREGDPAHDLFLVRSGHLRLSLPANPGAGAGRAGPGRIVAIAGPWEVTGEEALVPDAPRRLTACSGEPAQLTVLPGAAVRPALQASRKTLEAFLLGKEEEIALARALSVPRREGGSKARLGALLLHLGARLGRTEGKGLRIPVRLTHQVLADLSASHRSTVTTLLNDWIYEGALKDDGKGLLILERRALGGIPVAVAEPLGSVDRESA